MMLVNLVNINYVSKYYSVKIFQSCIQNFTQKSK